MTQANMGQTKLKRPLECWHLKQLASCGVEALLSASVCSAAHQIVTGEAARGKRLMVFCNTLDSCRATEHHLRERGVPTLCYHGDVPLDGRREAIAQFSDSEPGPDGQPVMVCTDLAARSAAQSLHFPRPICTACAALESYTCGASFFPFFCDTLAFEMVEGRGRVWKLTCYVKGSGPFASDSTK